MVHGYDAVQQALRDPALHVMTSDYPDRRGAQRWRAHPALRTLVRSIFFTDGPDHARVRRLFAQAFSARRVAGLEPAVVRIIERRLDRLAELGAGGAPVDLLAEFALPVPSDVVGELLGVPESDRDFFPERVRTFGAILDLGAGVWRHQQAADTAAEELTAYFADLVAKRRAEPRDDLVSALVHGGGDISDDELLREPADPVQRRVRHHHAPDRQRAGAAARPSTRDSSGCWPTRCARRASCRRSCATSRRPTSASGGRPRTPSSPGSRCRGTAGCWCCSAPRTGTRHQFPDPDTFDPGRDQGQPMSFGLGVHYCLGAVLSRMEGQLALPMLLRRFPKLALAGEPGERRTLMLRGYETLPVTLS